MTSNIFHESWRLHNIHILSKKASQCRFQRVFKRKDCRATGLLGGLSRWSMYRGHSPPPGPCMVATVLLQVHVRRLQSSCRSMYGGYSPLAGSRTEATVPLQIHVQRLQSSCRSMYGGYSPPAGPCTEAIVLLQVHVRRLQSSCRSMHRGCSPACP